MNDVSTLRNADCGIATEGATEAAQSAADIVSTKPGIWELIRAIQTSRQVFQQVHNFIAQQTIITLHALLVTLWYFAVYGEVLLLRLLIFSTHISDLARLIYPTSSADTPFSKTLYDGGPDEC